MNPKYIFEKQRLKFTFSDLAMEVIIPTKSITEPLEKEILLQQEAEAKCLGQLVVVEEQARELG